MKFTTFKNQNSFHSELIEANDKLLKLLNNSKNTLNNDLYPVKKDSYHFLTEIMYPNDRIEKTLFSSIVSSMQKSEFASAQSSFFTTLFSSFLIKELLKHKDILSQNEIILNEQIEKTLEKVKNLISKNSKIITKESLFKQIYSICENNILANVIIEILNLTGLEGKINIENSQQSNYLIEMKTGYNFKLNPFKFFLNNNLWKEQNVKVLVIDGVIEKVSELNTILNKSMETKLPMVIVAYGFSEEVVATLKANKDRNILNVFPVRVISELESLNIVNDIAIVCGVDVISSLKGEQVQFINYDLIPTVQSVRCTSEEFTIENNKTIGTVSAHIKTLLKKREENISIEDIVNFLDKRIKNLFSHTVTVHLPNLTKSENDFIRTKIDITLRTCKTLLSYGTTSVSNVILDLEKNVETEIDKIFLTVFKNIKNELETLEMPTLSFFLGMYFTIKSIIPLLTSKGFIEITS